MICYKDRMWCVESKYCGNTKCSRNYTDEEKQRNADGVNLPVNMGFLRDKECGFVDKEENK